MIDDDFSRTSKAKHGEPFKARLPFAKFILIIGVILVSAGVYTGVSHIALIYGVIFIIVPLLDNRLEMLRIFDDRTEFKFAMLKELRVLKNSDLIKIDTRNGALTLTIINKGKTEQRKFPLTSFSSKDKKRLIAHYESVAKQTRDNIRQKAEKNNG